MATQSREQSSPIIKLFTDPKRFDFFQAVRLLEYVKRKSISFPNEVAKISENIGIHSREDFINFATISKCGLPLSSVVDLELVRRSDNSEDMIPKLFIPFMGLTGVYGALPHYYTEKLLYYSHLGDHALKDFFDMFNHRVIFLLYKAWKKNQCYVGYSHIHNPPEKTDSFTYALESLAGADSKFLISHLKIEKETFAYYASLFVGQISSAMAIEALLNEYFELPIKILQFQGRWLYLSKQEYSIIADKKSHNGRFNQLGHSLILGQRKWCIQSMFRIYIGPITYNQFIEIKPNSDLLNTLIQMTHIYINAELNFDIQVELLASEIPACYLRQKESMTLGWNTWLRSKPIIKNDNSVVIQISNNQG